MMFTIKRICGIVEYTFNFFLHDQIVFLKKNLIKRSSVDHESK